MSCLDRRGVRVQRDPLPVAVVGFLEAEIMASTFVDDIDFIGFILFCLHCRARVGDANRLDVEPFLDVSGADPTSGFIDAGFLRHKNAARARSKMRLPVVGCAFGLTGKPWASKWLTSRRAAGRNAAVDKFLLGGSAFDGGEVVRVKASTADVSDRMAAYLHDNGLYKEGDNFGSHSLKATLLSWGAKFGLPIAIRRKLGGHAKARESSALSYSRDELAEPLRRLEDMLSRINGGDFNPDATRSGRWAPAAAEADGTNLEDDLDEIAVDPVLVPTVVASESSSEISSGSDSSAVASEAAADDDEEADYDDVGFVMNMRTLTIHVIDQAASRSLLCGLRWPHHGAPAEHTAATAHGARRCRRCFKQ